MKGLPVFGKFLILCVSPDRTFFPVIFPVFPEQCGCRHLQGPHPNCILILPVFSLFNFPCANVCDLWLLLKQNWLGSIQLKKIGNFHSKHHNIFTFRIREFTTWANFFGAKFPNSLCFPWQGFLLKQFSLFSLSSGDPDLLCNISCIHSW